MVSFAARPPAGPTCEIGPIGSTGTVCGGGSDGVVIWNVTLRLVPVFPAESGCEACAV